MKLVWSTTLSVQPEAVQPEVEVEPGHEPIFRRLIRFPLVGTSSSIKLFSKKS